MVAEVGLAAALVAAVGWGSWQVVVKKYSTSLQDGFAFQFWMSLGVLLVGLASVCAAESTPGYAPGDGGRLGELRPTLPLLCALSGVLWAIGNAVTVPIVQTIGMGRGMAIPCGTSILVAYMAGRVGPCFFHECLQPTFLAYPALGVAGCTGSVVCLMLFSLVKTTRAQKEEYTVAESPIRESDMDGAGTSPLTGSHASYRGIVLAVFCGLMQGVQFVPASIYAQRHPPDTDSDHVASLRLMFAQYTGSFFAAFLIYCGYVCYKRARGLWPAPVPLEAMLPSILSGMIWGAAGIFTMLAIDQLGYGVGYALTTNGSFLISIVWSTAYFKEIRGKRNLVLFAAAVVVNLASSFAIAEQRRLSELIVPIDSSPPPPPGPALPPSLPWPPALPPSLRTHSPPPPLRSPPHVAAHTLAASPPPLARSGGRLGLHAALNGNQSRASAVAAGVTRPRPRPTGNASVTVGRGTGAAAHGSGVAPSSPRGPRNGPGG
uniref:EamA domain-containing protein n=1 Tax=Chrysotila carterae TaxID=13221 RepID=A0A7S4BCJ9_CHRCT